MNIKKHKLQVEIAEDFGQPCLKVCTNEYQWVCIQINSVEMATKTISVLSNWVAQQYANVVQNSTHNTGSQKLPTLVECERWYVKKKCGLEHITELEKNVIREIHDYICRQLRAGA